MRADFTLKCPVCDQYSGFPDESEATYCRACDWIEEEEEE